MPFQKGQPRPAGAGRRAKSQMPRLEVVYKAIGWFKPYERNPRKNDKAVDRIRASIKQFGFAVPILARSTGEVIDGHLRLKGAVAEKLAELPVILCDGWTDAQVKAFRLMVNRSVTWADWDLDALALEFADIKGLDFDLSMTGFDTREIDALLLTPNAAEDDVPPVPEAPVTRTGDLWLLGPHRLLCGSSISPENTTRVLGGAKPLLMITDPPYGIELDMEWRDRRGHNEMAPAAKSYMKVAMEGKGISVDTIADWSASWESVPSIEVAYVWHAALNSSDVARGIERTGFQIRQHIVWRKTVFAMSRGAYQWSHEPCWYAVKRGRQAHWIGGSKQTTVWDAASPKHIMSGSDEEKLPHPTQKPVELMRRPMVNHGKPNDGVYEPFGGSGTTLAAAELTGRVCYCIEIEPRFVDVIVTRWQNLTGKQATLEGDGRMFAEIKAERCEVVAA